MIKSFKTKRIFAPAALLVVLGGASAHADDRYSPVKDKVVVKECGSCHMVFQPEMLPAKSWRQIIAGLANHFGENAALDTKTAAHIETVLVKDAADSRWWGGKFMRGLTDASAPLRITETPYWIRKHRKEVPDRAWRDPKVKSKANCMACHPRADRGDYDDD